MPPASLTDSIARVFGRIAPLRLADRTWDNVGVLLDPPPFRPSSQSPSPPSSTSTPAPAPAQVFLTIDLTPPVLEEVECALDRLPSGTPTCIVSYHPPLFRPLRAIRASDALQRALLRAAHRSIGIYAPHTSLDACQHGINDWLLSTFTTSGQITSKPIQVLDQHDPQTEGFGRLLHFPSPRSLSEIIRAYKLLLGVQTLMLARPALSPFTPPSSQPSTADASELDLDQPQIRSIAVCAGSGSSVLKDAEADLYLTGEMSHHDILAATAKGRYVILANHTNTERGFLRTVLAQRLMKELETDGVDAEVHVVAADRDPLIFV